MGASEIKAAGKNLAKKSCSESKEPLGLRDGVLPLTGSLVFPNQNPAFTELFGTTSSLLVLQLSFADFSPPFCLPLPH